jgi:hypothetical protein
MAVLAVIRQRLSVPNFPANREMYREFRKFGALLVAEPNEIRRHQEGLYDVLVAFAQTTDNKETQKNSGNSNSVGEIILLMSWRGITVIVAFACLTLSLQTTALGEQHAKTLFAAHTLPFYIHATGHRTLGTITPGTPLQVAGSEKNGLLAFTLDAWTQQGDDTTLFAAHGRRIVLANLDKGAPHLKTLSTVKDEYDNVWNEVELSGFVQSSGLTPDQDAIWTQARALYSARCSACHALHHTDEFTANQWPKILKMMTKNAALQPDQAALVTQYVQTHSKQ